MKVSSQVSSQRRNFLRSQNSRWNQRPEQLGPRDHLLIGRLGPDHPEPCVPQEEIEDHWRLSYKELYAPFCHQTSPVLTLVI